MMEAVHQRNTIKMFQDDGANLPAAACNGDGIMDGSKPLANRPVLRNIENLPRRTTLNREAKTKTHLTEDVGKLTSKHKENLKSAAVVETGNAINCNDNFNKIKDIDADDTENHVLCAEYIKDIYKYLRKSEKRLLPTDYMPSQGELSEKMRTILIDWLIQVHAKFNLLQETLYLTICTLDRYLQNQRVTRQELQLVGVTAMLLASKYEEMYAPELADFVYITDNAYSKNKIKAMEQKMIKTLEYDFSNPLSIHFLRRNSKAGEVNATKHSLAKYFMELCLINYNLSQKLPSQIAAAALYLSIRLIDSSEWTETLKFYSGYSEEELMPVVCDIAALTLSPEATKYDAVKVKYASKKLMCISKSDVLHGPLIKRLASVAKRCQQSLQQ